MTLFIAPKYVVEVYRPGVMAPDRFGNLVPSPGVWESVKVAQWWVSSTDEVGGDSVLRTFDVLTVHFPTGLQPMAAGRVRLPDGTVWEVEGNIEDYNHGFHGWNPGLVVVHCKRVEG